MNENYFSIERDNQFPCFCQACVVGKTEGQMSLDPRYCKGCFYCLLKESEILSPRKRPGWIPKAHNSLSEGKITGEKQYPIPEHLDKQKTKMSTLNSPSVTVDNFRPRGRPKTYKKRSLPDDKIKQLDKDGMGAKAIVTQLKTEEGIEVSYKTIQRVLSGERG